MRTRIRIVVTVAGLASIVLACGTGDGSENALDPDGASTVSPEDSAVEGDAPVVTEAPAPDDEAASDTEAPPETEAPPDTEAPPETEAPPDTEAPPSTDPADGEDDDGEGGSGTGTILVIAAFVLFAVAAGILISGRRRSGSRRSGDGTPQVRPTTLDLDDRVLGDISWFNEQLSLDVLSATPAEGRERWRAERPRIEALTRDCQRLEESVGDPIWGALAGEVATLAQSLDTATMSRVSADSDPSVTAQAIDQVNRHRSQLAGLAMQVRRR